MQSTQFRIRNEGQGRKGRDCPDRLPAFADEVTERRLLQCISPFMAHSVALNPFCQGLLVEGEADTNAAAR
jgi:hypothetical protein